MKAASQKGFTLIELSMVLVIIGLLVGGMLAGKELIHAAEIRSAIREKESFELAIKTFQLKYNCLPGDCANADTFLGVACGDATTDPNVGCNGNGDGNIFNIFDGDIARGEHLKFWMHLSLANLIPGSYSGRGNDLIPGISIPYSKWQGLVWAATVNVNAPTSNNDKVNGFNLAGPNFVGWPTLNGGDYVMSLQDAYTVDSKIDDGIPNAGRVLGDGGEDCGGDTYFPDGYTPHDKICSLSFLW